MVGVGIGVGIVAGAGTGGGDGDVGSGAETLSITLTSTGAPPPAGVMVTAVIYNPGCKSVASAVNVNVDDAPGASRSLVGLTCSQGASGGTFAVHANGPAPVLVTVTDCDVLVLPLIA